MAVVNVPFENSTDSLGCRKAGKNIIKLFPEIYTGEYGNEVIKKDTKFESISFFGRGLDSSYSLINKKAKKIIDSNYKSIFLGGDHSITYPIITAFYDNCVRNKKIPFLIVFDAHPDCKIGEDKIPNNTQWLSALVKSGFPTKNIIIVGMRASSKSENLFLSENSIKVYGMKDLNDFEEICDIIMELSRSNPNNEVYLSIDIDVVDSSFVPGTFRPESGGLTSRQIIYFIQRINMLKNLRVIDITEINPDKDINSQTINLGVKILGELLANPNFQNSSVY